MKTLIILILALSPLTTFGGEIDHTISDIAFYDGWNQEVPESINSVYKNRFIYLVHREKAKIKKASIIYR